MTRLFIYLHSFQNKTFLSNKASEFQVIIIQKNYSFLFQTTELALFIVFKIISLKIQRYGVRDGPLMTYCKFWKFLTPFLVIRLHFYHHKILDFPKAMTSYMNNPKFTHKRDVVTRLSNQIQGKTMKNISFFVKRSNVKITASSYLQNRSIH